MFLFSHDVDHVFMADHKSSQNYSQNLTLILSFDITFRFRLKVNGYICMFFCQNFCGLFASQKEGLFFKERILSIENSERKKKQLLEKQISLLYQLTHMEKGGRNENDRVSSLETIPIHLTM